MNDDDFEYKVNPCSACLKRYDIKDFNKLIFVITHPRKAT